MFSPNEILVALVVGFLVFGSKKLPEMAKSLGQGVQEFKKAVNSVTEEAPAPAANTTTAAAPASPTAPPPPAAAPVAPVAATEPTAAKDLAS